MKIYKLVFGLDIEHIFVFNDNFKIVNIGHVWRALNSPRLRELAKQIIFKIYGELTMIRMCFIPDDNGFVQITSEDFSRGDMSVDEVFQAVCPSDEDECSLLMLIDLYAAVKDVEKIQVYGIHSTDVSMH